MVRILSFFVFVFSASVQLHAQSPDQWIEFGKTYYKIPVAKDGIYRLTYQELQQHGFPVDGTNPQHYQIFHRGIEQSILVTGEQDGSFNDGDFLEFYGQKNDGSLDELLYKPGRQPHKLYNLFSDTTVYFLTYGSAIGKRIQHIAESNPGNISPQPFHLDESLLVLSEQYALGESQRDEIYSSTFEYGEGWTSTAIRQGQTRDFTVTGIKNTFPAGQLPQLEILLTGRNLTQHTVEILVGSSLRLLQTVTTPAVQPYLFTEPLQWSDINGENLTVRIRIPNRGYLDMVSVSYIRLVYPQEPNASGLPEKTFNTVAGNDKINLVIQNSSPGSRLFDITSLHEVSLLETSGAPEMNTIVPNAINSRKLFLTGTVQSPKKITPVRFRNMHVTSSKYVVISHPLLRRSAGGYSDPVKAYAAYRASPEGGGYDTMVVNIQELYDQFSYGEKSPLAVYRFMDYVSSQTRPAYLFIIGKGLEYHLRYYRTATAGTWDHQDLVPTGGSPGSDEVFSRGLGAQPNTGVPTGRLPAMKAGQVAAYLNKIKESETAPYDGLWRKKILHLSGGIESWEPAAFKGYLKDYQEIAEGPYLGGDVNAIAKASRDVQTINIASEVNNGLGLITFFGHSSTTTLDFDIGNVTNKILGYKNRGKYPILLMNGCEVGAFFLRRNLFGEDWVLADTLGASGFIAHNAYALTQNLYRYSRTFYEVAYADSVFIKKGIGDIKNETAKRYLAGGSSSIGNVAQIQQMILLGDPAVKLFGASKPDLEVRESQLSIQSFDMEPVTAFSDSFAIKMIVRNYGLAVPGLFRVEVERTLPDNTSLLYDSIFTVPGFQDTLLFVIRKGDEVSYGNNHFRIRLDADDIIDELNESNNEAEYDLFIPSNGTRNLYPTKFAIVNSNEITFAFQSTDLFADEREFVIELDTVKTFSSLFKKQFLVKGKVLASKRIEIQVADTLAYYWRTRLANPLVSESKEWTTSSFTFIKDEVKEGWAQVHFPQFLDNPAFGLEKNESLRRIEFATAVTPVEITTFGGSSGKPRDSVSVKIAGAEFNLYTQGMGCRMNTINLIAFDRKSTIPYLGVYLKWYEIMLEYGNRRLLCGREPFVINSFMWNEVSTGKSDLIAYIDNVATGDSVVLYTMGSASFHLWPQAAKDKVAEIGISLVQLNSFSAGEPIVIYTKKGGPPGSAKIYRAPGAQPAIGMARLKVSETITGGFTSGNIKSALVGPAYEWNSFLWRSGELEATDKVRFDVSGVKPNMQEVVLIEDASAMQDLSHIDAHEFPFLRLTFHVEDETLLTATQLKKWIVYFTPVPEGVLLPSTNSTEHVTLQEGEMFHKNFRFVNISEKSFADSLEVKSSLYNYNVEERFPHFRKIKAPDPGDTTFFTIERSTMNFGGWNDLEVFVNPRLVPEQHYDNNIIQLKKYIHVDDDLYQPVTDVTFDGRYIMNDDFVSPQPLIRIMMWDENHYLLKKDTIGFKISLAGPCSEPPCVPSEVFFTRDDLKWYPATESSNFRVDFSPVLEDGKYTLQVQSADVKGNAPSTPFEISFVVDSGTRVLLHPPYPNPFTYELNYGFSVSGSKAPEAASFIVHDITGRQIYVQSHDVMKIGDNSFYWSGIDARGNYLKPGIFLFTLSLTVDGKPYIRQGKIIISR